MKILWIDPVNSDPQFLNALALAMVKEGNDVIVRSNRRHIFNPPRGVKWSPFSIVKKFPQSLEGKKIWRLVVAAMYPLNWLRAVRFAKACKVKSVLITTNLAMPSIDTWGLRMLRRAGIAPVIVVHKPYYNFFKDPDQSQSYRYSSFYNEAVRILVMTNYTKEILQKMYGLSDDRFVKFALPHYSDLLSDTPMLLDLRDSLQEWASSCPVVAFISHVTTERGIETFLSSLPTLKEIVPGIRVLFVSRLLNVSKRQHIEQVTRKAGMEKQCFFHWEPYSDSELLSYLAVTSVIVVPYNNATQSGVISLAAGFGIPVVATSVGGLPEMLIPGETGEIVPPNAPRALAYAIAKIVSPNAICSYRKNVTKYAGTHLSPKNAAQIVCQCMENAKVSLDESVG